MEQYLNDLDKSLLRRSNLKIVRMYLEKKLSNTTGTTQETGQGKLIEVPLATNVKPDQPNQSQQNTKEPKESLLKRVLINRVVYNPLLYRFLFKNLLKRRYPRALAVEATNIKEVTKRIFSEYKIDLIIMHHIGGVDSAQLIEEAVKFKIPYVFINHYSNKRFDNISIREQLNSASGIGGVSSEELPNRLKDCFFNVSDGIDLQIFNPDLARPINIYKDIPIIFYPARITQVKGQIDLIEVYRKLRTHGVRAMIVFAGRTDSPQYEKELKDLTIKYGITDNVLFLGQLSTDELRDWLNISSVMAFPTYHAEGLGRILVEAQAMKVPTVAYIIGGTPAGIANEKTGFLVRKGDINLFTEKIRFLLTDEAKREAMGENGRRFVEEYFSLERLARRHEKFYLKVLETCSNLGRKSVK